MPENPGVQIAGLKELRRDLKKVDTGLPPLLKTLGKQIGEQLLLPDAKRRADRSFPNAVGNQTRAGAKLAGSLRVLSQQTGGQLVMGGARFPYAAGMEWGTTGRNPRARQFPLRAGVATGFILYPVIRDKQDAIRDAYEQGLIELLNQAGLSEA